MKKFNINTSLLKSIQTSNENHKEWIYNNFRDLTENKQIKKVLIWGLAYTENTDTLRRSLSIEIAKWLRTNKTNIFAYDDKIKKISSSMPNLNINK